MESPAATSDVHFTCMFVSRSQELHIAINQTLSALRRDLRHERDAQTALRRAGEQSIPVIIAGYDVDWSRMLEQCSKSSNPPSVVVLLPSADPLAWADALSRGAVDAVDVTADHTRLMWTLSAAYRRWERRQLVREAVSQNPLMRTA